MTTRERLERIRAALRFAETAGAGGGCGLCSPQYNGPGLHVEVLDADGHEIPCPLPNAILDVEALLASRTAEDERSDTVAWLRARGEWAEDPLGHYDGAAEAFEAGEHIGAATKPEPWEFT